MERKYDEITLTVLREEERVEQIFGTEVIVRKVPFSLKKGTMDSRWKEFKYSGRTLESGMTPSALSPEIFTLPAEDVLLKIQEMMLKSLIKKDKENGDVEFDVHCEFEGIKTEKRIIGVYRYERNSGLKEKRPCAIFFHGGGWFMGKPLKNDPAYLFLADKTNAVVFDVDYALAPQNKFPEGLNDCQAILSYVYENPEMYRYMWFWKKETPTGFLNANYKPLNAIEEIVVFSKATVGSLSKIPIPYHPPTLQAVDKKKRNRQDNTWREAMGYMGKNNALNSTKEYTQKFTNYPTTILEYAREKEAVHPTQKPTALLEFLIRTYTNEEDMVLDNCMGSGSTGVACKKTNRNFIGIEKEPKYYKIAQRRVLA